MLMDTVLFYQPTPCFHYRDDGGARDRV